MVFFNENKKNEDKKNKAIIILFVALLLFFIFVFSFILFISNFADDFYSKVENLVSQDISNYNSGNIPSDMFFLSTYKNHKSYKKFNNSIIVNLNNDMEIIISEYYEDVIKGDVYYKYYPQGKTIFSIRICFAEIGNMKCYFPFNYNELEQKLINPLLEKEH